MGFETIKYHRGVRYMERINGNWGPLTNYKGVSFFCGYCSTIASPSIGYQLVENATTNRTSSSVRASIYICPNCNRPTLKKYGSDEQYPGPKLGQIISFLPSDIEQLYNEVRDCISVNAFTSAVLSARKVLMNTAVSKGAEEGKRFVYYVTYLQENHFIPPNSSEWVDHIRTKGNEATHEIPSMSKEDAIELLEFVEMLLRFVYEMPGKMMRFKD